MSDAPSLSEIRVRIDQIDRIDQLDREVVALLAEREQLVRAAGRHKTDGAGVRASSRSWSGCARSPFPRAPARTSSNAPTGP